MVAFLQDFLQNIVDFIFYILPQKTPSEPVLDNCKIIAHRGWHDDNIKENTIRSFEMCLDTKIHGIEFDVRWTKDLVPIIHHDKTLERVFGSSLEIKSATFEELRRQFPLIPSLREVVQSFGKKLHFFIELKDEDFSQLKKQKTILKKELQTLEPLKDFHFFSVTPSVFEKFNDFKKEAYIIVATTNIKDMSAVVEKNNYGGLAGHYFLLSEKILSLHKNRGRVVGTGYPKHKKSLHRELNRGVDYIFTNHPKELLDTFIE